MTLPRIWSHRLHNLPISSLSNLRLPHKAHLLIFISSWITSLGQPQPQDLGWVARRNPEITNAQTTEIEEEATLRIRRAAEKHTGLINCLFLNAVLVLLPFDDMVEALLQAVDRHGYLVSAEAAR